MEGLGEFEGATQIHRLDIFTGVKYLLGDVVIKIPRTCHQTKQGYGRRKDGDELDGHVRLSVLERLGYNCPLTVLGE